MSVPPTTEGGEWNDFVYGMATLVVLAAGLGLFYALLCGLTYLEYRVLR